LTADVEGDIAEVDDVLRITTIRMTLKARIPSAEMDSVQRLLEHFSDKCPAYQSVKGCIDCSWDSEFTAEA